MNNTFQNENENSLAHYGVLGMKWGVRRGKASQAYTKAVRKKRTLEQRSSYYNVKAARKQLKATRILGTAISAKGMKRGYRTQYKANRLNMKSARLQRKGVKWTRQMEKVFSGYDIKRIPDGNISAGKSWLYRRVYGNDSYEVTKPA